MRKALIVGIDHYDKITHLKCAHNDAERIAELLGKHASVNGEPNFDCKVLLSSKTDENRITRSFLQQNIRNLFEDEESDIVLFYFSGHGFLSNHGGYLVSQDSTQYEEGVSFNDIMIYAGNSSAKEIIIILDCCKSGSLGKVAHSKTDFVTLRKGMTILTSSNDTQDSFEKNGQGIFSGILISALEGGGADIQGNVKLARIYELADSMLGPWEQRPLLKTSSSRLSIIRKTKPKISYTALKRIPDYFKGPDYYLKLDPSFDPDLEPRHKKNEAIMKDLREMYHQGLVKPVDEEYLYYAAKNHTGCELTPLGKQYWNLLNRRMI